MVGTQGIHTQSVGPKRIMTFCSRDPRTRGFKKSPLFIEKGALQTRFDVLGLVFWDGCEFGICYNHVTLVDKRHLLFEYIFCLGGMGEVFFV